METNINYLQISNSKSQLNSLLASYNLHSAVDFPTRVTKNSSRAIDNIFIDKVKNSNYSIEPFICGLSDHDVQILVLHNIIIQYEEAQPTVKRQINEITISYSKCE